MHQTRRRDPKASSSAYRLLAILLSMLVGLAAWGVPAAHATYVPSGTPSGSFALGSGDNGGLGQDIASLRTQTSDTYAQNGHYVTRIYGTPVNYQDSGQWKPIDNTLVTASTPGYVQNKANTFTALLPQDLSQPVRLQTGSGSVAFSLVGGSGSGTVSGATTTYPITGGSIAYTVQSTGVKEAISLSGPTSPSSFVFSLSANGVTARSNGSAGIDFVDSSGKVAFSFAPPTMQDAAGVQAPASAISLAVAQTAQGQNVTLSADPTWLHDTSRQYPVVIDPTATLTPPGCSGYINSVNQVLRACDYGYVETGYFSGPYRGLLYFDTSAIPADATVQSAQVSLDAYNINGISPLSLSLYQLTKHWTSGATWRYYDGFNYWTTWGGDFVSTPVGTTNVGPTYGWYTWPVSASLVQGWVNGTTANDGLLLKETTEGTGTRIWFGGGSSPYIQVTYNRLTGARPYYTLVGQQLWDNLGLGVNVAGGNLIVQQGDVQMPGVGLPFSLGRTYNSMSTATGSFGSKWTMNTGRDVGLLINGTTGAITYSGPSGEQMLFVPNANYANQYVSPPGTDADLIKNSDGTYTLTGHASGVKANFTSSGYLNSIKDRSGNTIAFTYTGSQLASIHDTLGQTTQVTYTGSTISQITDAANRNYAYGYTNGLLTSYIDPANEQTQFGYDGNGNLTTITDPKDKQTTIAYNPDGTVASVTRSASTGSGPGASWTFTYNNGSTSVTDPNNHTTTYAFDGQGRVTSVINPDNTSSVFTWTADDQVASSKTPSSAITTLTYDGNNNLTQISYPGGAAESCAYGNSSFPYQPSSCTDTQGNATSYGYNSQGLVNQVTDGNNHSSSATYNANGTVASTTDENNHTTTYSYQSNGLPAQDTPPCPNGSVPPCAPSPTPLGPTSYHYNSYNLEDQVTDGNGRLTTFSYDAVGRVSGVSYADGTSVGYSYDANGNLLAMSDSAGTTTYTVNNLNQLTQETKPNGQSISYTFDPVGNLLHKTDSGGTITYGYNQNDQVNSVTDRQNGNYSLGYNQDGDQTSITFPNGVTESMGYNTAGQLTSVQAKDSSNIILTSFTYSYTNPSTSKATLLPYSVTDAANRTTAYTYDGNNALTSAVQTSGGTPLNNYSFGYDNAGNLTSKTINGTSTTFTFNAVNQLTQASGGMAMTYTYDGNGDRISSSDGTHLNVNAAGQITGITPPNGTAIPYTYTGVGEQRRIGNGSTKYQYDGTGLSKQTDSLGDTYFTVLPDGTLLSETIPSGTYAGTYYYLDDGAGSVTAVVDASGVIKDSYTYDPVGNAAASGSVPNPFTYGGAMYDSQTGYYYTGGGYYDPQTGQSFGCKDKGKYDPGEDLCGSDADTQCGGDCAKPPGGGLIPMEEEVDPGLGGGAVPSGEGGGGEMANALQWFTQDQVDRIINSANEVVATGPERTLAQRKLESHINRTVNPSPSFGYLPKNPSAKQADAVIRYVLNNIYFQDNSSKWMDFYAPNGVGIRIGYDYKFRTFIDYKEYLARGTP